MQRKKKIGGREKMVKHVCSTSAMTRNLLKDGYVINWYYRYAHLVFESPLTAAHVCHTTNAKLVWPIYEGEYRSQIHITKNGGGDVRAKQERSHRNNKLSSSLLQFLRSLF